MTTAADPDTPIFNALIRELLSSQPGRGAHAAPGSACTPEFWFGPPEKFARDQDTQGMPVVGEPKRQAS